eukprot:1492892-Rhodomonas_salina.2
MRCTRRVRDGIRQNQITDSTNSQGNSRSLWPNNLLCDVIRVSPKHKLAVNRDQAVAFPQNPALGCCSIWGHALDVEPSVWRDLEHHSNASKAFLIRLEAGFPSRTGFSGSHRRHSRRPVRGWGWTRRLTTLSSGRTRGHILLGAAAEQFFHHLAEFSARTLTPSALVSGQLTSSRLPTFTCQTAVGLSESVKAHGPVGDRSSLWMQGCGRLKIRHFEACSKNSGWSYAPTNVLVNHGRRVQQEEAKSGAEEEEER